MIQRRFISRRSRAGVRLAIAAAVLGPTLALLPVRLIAIVSAQAYPGNTTSHYVTSLSTSAAYSEGCSTADEVSQPSNAVVILDFGPAARDISNGVTSYG